MTYEELKGKYKNKTVGEGWFLLSSNDAVKFIEEGFDKGLKLVAVEGFLRSPEGAFEPRQEHGSDQFMNLNTDEFKRKAFELIESSSQTPNVFFEVWME